MKWNGPRGANAGGPFLSSTLRTSGQAKTGEQKELLNV